MTGEQCLNKAKKIEQEINAKVALIESMKKTLDTALLNNDTELLEQVESLKQATRKLFAYIQKVTATIDKIDNENYKALLMYYYLNNYTMVECSQVLFVTFQTIHRWKIKALQAFSEVWEHDQ